MPISHKHKIIFIHVPKNAGTSVTSLPELSFEDTKNGHRTALNAKKAYSDFWENYLKCCIVRNPWDRFVSNFEYAKMEKSYWHSSDGTTAYGKHPDFDTLKNMTFTDAVNLASESLASLTHPGWLPQKYYICDRNNAVLVDNIFYSENLASDKKFNTIFPGVLKINTSTRQSQNYRDYYTSETAHKIQKLYATDIELFSFKY